jgi:hypothetical protein
MLMKERLTYSLNGAAYAVAKGVRLLRTYRETSGKSTLVLDDGYGQATSALNEFWQGEPMVNAREYAECRRYLIEEINATRNNNKETTTNAATAAAK